MVYSSRSCRTPRGAASFEVTAARPACDAHRIRGVAVRRVAPMCSYMLERLTRRREGKRGGEKRGGGIYDFRGSEAAVDSLSHGGGDRCWRIDCVAAARQLRL